MALEKSYTLSVIYASELKDSSVYNIFGDVLSEQEINLIKEPVVKEFVIENAYYRIDNVQGSKNNIDLVVGIYKNKEGVKCIKNLFVSFVPNVNENADNFIKQGYEFLKSLDYFENAIDV